MADTMRTTGMKELDAQAKARAEVVATSTVPEHIPTPDQRENDALATGAMHPDEKTSHTVTYSGAPPPPPPGRAAAPNVQHEAPKRS
jgi:hypothetical protein